MTTLILSAAPLSETFRERLAAQIEDSEVRHVSLSRLRHSPLAEWRNELVRRVDTLCVVAESSQQQATMSVLMGAAAVVPARRRLRWDSGGRFVPFGVGAAVGSLGATAAASASSLLSLALAHRELSRLRDEARIEPRPMTGHRMLYLKSTLTPGVVAGGSVGHVAGVINGFAARGYEVVVASLDEPPGVPRSLERFRLEPLRTYSFPTDANNYRFSHSCTRLLLAHRDALRPDVVYQRMATGNYAGVQLARSLGVPFILEYNGSEAWIARNWGKPLTFERTAMLCEEVCLRHAHAVVTVSDVLRDELIERGVAPGDIVSYPNGVDERVFDAERFDARARGDWRRKYGIADDALLVCFVGTFGKWHGAEILAEAARRVLSKSASGPNRFHFVFVGDGLTLPTVRRTLEPFRDAVTFTGLIEQSATPLVLATSDVLVSPHRPNDDGTRFIGSPTKLFEYMAMAKPIIASRLGQIEDVLMPSIDAKALSGARSVLAADNLAVFVEPGSVEELVLALDALAADRALRESLGRKARERVVERYTWTRHVGAIAARIEPQR